MKQLVSNIDKLKSSKYDTKKGFSSIMEKIKAEEAHSAKTKSTKIRFLSFGRISAAAAIAALVVTSYFFFQGGQNHFETVIGQQVAQALPDDSEVTLNATSVLDYTDTGDKRQVQLNGEAFFDVTKNENKPFEITTPLGNVKVVGTSFNVFGRTNALVVTCYTGEVKVSSPSDPNNIVTLKTGDEYLLRKGGKASSYKKNINASPSWTSGISKFENVPFQEVLDEFQRQYDVEVRGSTSKNTQMVTTSFPHGDLKSATKIICGSVGINHEVQGNDIIILK